MWIKGENRECTQGEEKNGRTDERKENYSKQRRRRRIVNGKEKEGWKKKHGESKMKEKNKEKERNENKNKSQQIEGGK